MPTFHVYCEFYGKKLKIEVEAANEFRADLEVRSRLRILEIKEKEKEKVVDVPDFIKDIFKHF